MQELPAARLDTLARNFLAEHRLPGLIYGIVDGAELARWSAHGHADPVTGRTADERTLYRIASITKTFTATAIMQLRDRGLVKLDDPATLFIPELRRASSRAGRIEDLTLRRMLTHESGLVGEPPTMDLVTESIPELKEILDTADRIELVIPPGHAHKYSNLAFALLGEIVERVSGISFRDWIRDEITAPLGMPDTTFEPDDEQRARSARGYNARTFSDDLTEATDRLKYTDGDGGLYSTVADLARWVGFQMDRSESAVLSPSTRAEMHRARILTDETWTEAQGLGWYASRHRDHVFIGHAGLINGFSSRIAFSVPECLSVIVLINGVGPASEIALAIADAALDLRSPPPKSLPPSSAPPGELKELLGLYLMRDFGESARIEWRGSELVLIFESEPEKVRTLAATGELGVFEIAGYREAGERLVVVRREDGSPAGITIAGYPYDRLA
jgi:CubicO group peptidase (beta-lactamase class C family)